MDTAGKETVQAVNLLLNHISELAMMWRGQPENRNVIEAEYHDTYKALRALGWDHGFDIDCVLPDENMPKEYIEAHPYIPSTLPWPAGWRTSKEIEEVQQRRSKKKTLGNG